MPEIKVVHEQKRRCGYRKEGGLYLVGESGPGGVLPRWVSIEPPILYEGGHFRGFVYVDGDQLLAREDQDTWWLGPSLDRVTKDKIVQALGMPLAVRRKFGIAKGCRTAEEVSDALSRLSLPDTELCHSQFANIAKSLQSALYKSGFERTEADAAVTDLATCRMSWLALTPPEILARCWVIARTSLWQEESHPSPARMDIVGNLMRLMTIVNAIDDAVALRSGDWRKAWKGK